MYKEQFINYLRVAIPKGASDKTCNHYTDALSGRITKYAKPFVSDFKSIFDLELNDAIKLLNIIKKNEELEEINKRDHNVFFKTFDYYLNFANCYQEAYKVHREVCSTTAKEGESYDCHSYEYTRNRTLRNAAAKRDNYTCRICGLNFTRTYGEIGIDFIEVHHKNPIKDGTRDTKMEDLISVCSNCHSMLHKKEPPYLPEVLKLLIELEK